MKQRVLALFAGANKFLGNPMADLAGPIRDCRLLWEAFGGPSVPEYRLLIDEEFTRERWFSEVGDIIERARVTGMPVILSISSHGASRGDGPNGGEEFCCYDYATGGRITDLDMRGVVAALPTGSGIIMDTCFSGSAVVPGSWQGFSGEAKRRVVNLPYKPRLWGGYAGVAQAKEYCHARSLTPIRTQVVDFLGDKWVLGSCQDWETAADVTSSVHGSFGLGTFAFVEAWKAGYRTLRDLNDQRDAWIKGTYGNMQTPTVTCSDPDLDLRALILGD